MTDGRAESHSGKASPRHDILTKTFAAIVVFSLCKFEDKRKLAVHGYNREQASPA
jgi:hypothetical protein